MPTQLSSFKTFTTPGTFSAAQTRLYFYHKIFSNENVNEIDWSKFQLAQFQFENNVNGLTTMLPIVAIILFLMMCCFAGLKTKL